MGYVIYLRKSRADLEAEARGEGETLARHRMALLDVAARKNLPVAEIYAEVVSGETISDRPVMQKLLSEVEKGMWHGVLVMEIERLARGDTIDQGIVARAFRFSNTKIITPMKTYDPGNEYDEEYFEFGLFMSRREYKTITRRMQRGRMASVQEGKFVGNRPPYGYKRIKLEREKGFILEPIPEQASAVRLIFEWFVNGNQRSDGIYEQMGYAKIAKRLNELHFPTSTGIPWPATTVREILTNPVYVGKVRWNRRPQVKHVKDGQVMKERPRAKEDIITIAQGLHPPIISQELFDAAQSSIRQRRESPVPQGKGLKNPLAKLVICGLCGKTMVRKPYRNGYPDTLLCNNPDCANISSQLHYVEERVLQVLGDWLHSYQWGEEADSPAVENVGCQTEKQALVRLKNELEKMDRQMDQLYNLLEQGVYTAMVFHERFGKLMDRKSGLEKEISLLERHIEERGHGAIQKKALLPEAACFQEIYASAGNPSEKNELLKQVLAKAVYIKTKNGQCRDNQPDDFQLVLYPLLPEER